MIDLYWLKRDLNKVIQSSLDDGLDGDYTSSEERGEKNDKLFVQPLPVNKTTDYMQLYQFVDRTQLS